MTEIAPPYQDSSVDVDRRVDVLLSRMEPATTPYPLTEERNRRRQLGSCENGQGW